MSNDPKPSDPFINLPNQADHGETFTVQNSAGVIAFCPTSEAAKRIALALNGQPYCDARAVVIVEGGTVQNVVGADYVVWDWDDINNDIGAIPDLSGHIDLLAHGEAGNADIFLVLAESGVMVGA